MPHFSHTPEALLGRNDSKNPDSTCKGITSSGRPCRRALAASPTARRKSNASAIGGVVALVEEDGEIQEADFYCYQHKDQVEQRVVEEEKDKRQGRRAKKRATELFPLEEKSSIDTLVQRLGISSDSNCNLNTRTSNNPIPPRRTATNDFATQQQSQSPYMERPPRTQYTEKPDQSKPKKKSFWASLCCMAGEGDDYVEIVRHKTRVEKFRPSQMDPQYGIPTMQMATARPPGQQASARIPSSGSTWSQSIPLSAPSPRKPVTLATVRTISQQRTPSSSQRLLSIIPPHLSAQTTSALLAELTKPISPHDEEGYIYIFWLTPQSKSAPPESTARSLLAPEARPGYERRISDVMTEYSYDGNEDAGAGCVDTGKGKKTIMLKIGRANNITRRMNEWQRQCGYALNLVRWYPYIPSSSPTTTQASPGAHRTSEPLYPDLSRPPTQQRRDSGTAGAGVGAGVKKIFCVKRVERLIHLELAEKQVKRRCGACGKEHREWFEVEASQAGVKAVDETVRRWVGWGERQAGT